MYDFYLKKHEYNKMSHFDKSNDFMFMCESSNHFIPH